MYIFDHISLISSQNKNVTDKIYRKKNQNTHFTFSGRFFSPGNRIVYETMWQKKSLEPVGATDDNMAHAHF